MMPPIDIPPGVTCEWSDRLDGWRLFHVGAGGRCGLIVQRDAPVAVWRMAAGVVAGNLHRMVGNQNGGG